MGYLNIRSFYFAREWLAAVLAALVVEVGVVTCIALLLHRLHAPLWAWFVSGVTLIVESHAIPPVESSGPILATLLFWCALETRESRAATVLALVGGVTAGVLVLVKVSAMVSLLPILAIFTVAALRQRFPRGAVAAGAACAATVVGLWISSGQRAGDVIPFLRGAIEFAIGFASALWYQGITLGIVFGTLLLAIALVTAGWLLWRHERASVLMLMSCAVLLSQFKDSFVRDGPERDVTFFAVAAVLALPVLIAVAGSLRSRLQASRSQVLALLGGFAAVLTGVTWSVVVARSDTLAWPDLSGYRTALDALMDPNARRDLERASQTSARTVYDELFPGIEARVGSGRLDVYPWDIGLIFAHPELHWAPRPVLSSYAAYTDWLDGLDAASLRAPTAPEYVLYRYAATDNRYPPFDEPAYFRELLSHYRMVATVGLDAVLMKRDDRPTSTDANRSEGTGCAPFGEMLAIPRVTGRWVFGAVETRFSPVGRVVAAVWKPAGIDVELRAGGAVSSYRFISGVADDGLFLSTLIGSRDDVLAAQSGRGTTPDRIGLSTTAPWEYGDSYCVSFYSVPVPA